LNLANLNPSAGTLLISWGLGQRVVNVSSIGEVARRKNEEASAKLKEQYDQAIKAVREAREKALQEASRRLEEAAREFAASLSS